MHSSSRGTHRGAAEREAAAEFSEQMNVGARYAAMLQVAEDGDVEIRDGAEAVADGERVEQALRRVLVRAIAGVDNGNIEVAGDKIGCSRGSVPHHQAIRLHRVQRVNGIEQRFAFFDAGGLGLQIHGVRAEPRSRGAETDAGARGIFEESEGHRLAAESGQLFQRMALDFLKGLGLVEKKGDFVRGERFEGEEITKTRRHTGHSFS